MDFLSVYVFLINAIFLQFVIYSLFYRADTIVFITKKRSDSSDIYIINQHLNYQAQIFIFSGISYLVVKHFVPEFYLVDSGLTLEMLPVCLLAVGLADLAAVSYNYLFLKCSSN